MPDIWFDVDTALAEVPVNKVPLVDDGDFKTIEGGVAYNAAGMALRWHFVTSAGAYTVTSVTPTSGGDYDWTDQGDSGVYTIEIPASGGASINNDTEGYGWFTGVATGILPWCSPIYGFRAAALNDALCDGGDNLDVNVTQFGGTNGTFASGRPEVNTTHLAGSSTTLSQLIAANLTYAGTASSGSTTTLVDAGLTQVDDYWIGSWVLFTSGNNIGQARLITDFVAGTDTVTFSPAVANSVTTHSYVIIPAAGLLAPQTGDSYARIGSTGSGLTTLATAATLSTVATNVSTIKSAMILAEGTNGSTGNDTTHIHMPALPYGDDEINDHALVIFDDSESEYHVCWITDWVNATKLATVTTLPFTPQNASDSYALLSLKRNVRSDVTAIAIADQVWEETLADHSGTSGSTAAALNAAGSAGDPWSTALPGAYGAGTAGKIIGDNINATVSSRSSHSAADVWAVGTRALTDKAGFTISGTTTTFDALQTALNSAHGSGSWATATGFSTHSAADVWAAASRTLTAGTNIQLPSNGLANVTAWTVAITGNITGNLSGSVGSVTGAVGSVTAGVNLADGAITDAKFTIPTLTSPASGPVGMLVQLWRRFFKKVTRDSDEIKTYADNGSTVVTTQTYTASGSDEDVGAAS